MLAKFAKNYPLVMRLSLAIVFVYFGISEILNPAYFSGYIPPFIASLTFFNSNLLIQTHGIALTLLSFSLLSRFHLRFIGILIMLMLIQIIAGLLLTSGFNEIVIRDIGLLGLALSIWLYEFKTQKET